MFWETLEITIKSAKKRPKSGQNDPWQLVVSISFCGMPLTSEMSWKTNAIAIISAKKRPECGQNDPWQLVVGIAF